MSKNLERFTAKQVALLKLYGFTVQELNKGNVGSYEDGIMMIHTLAVLLTSPEFPNTDLQMPDFVSKSHAEDSVLSSDEF